MDQRKKNIILIIAKNNNASCNHKKKPNSFENKHQTMKYENQNRNGSPIHPLPNSSHSLALIYMMDFAMGEF